MADDIVVGNGVYTPQGKSDVVGVVQYGKDDDGNLTIDMNGTHYVKIRTLPVSIHPVDWTR